VRRGRAQLGALFTVRREIEIEIEIDRRDGVIDYRPHHDCCDGERPVGAATPSTSTRETTPAELAGVEPGDAADTPTSRR